jgi:hypothetical protein
MLRRMSTLRSALDELGAEDVRYASDDGLEADFAELERAAGAVETGVPPAGRLTPGGSRAAGYMWAMSCSTRSSTERNGSLHSTVRWAWSLSFRWTQSTV